MLAKLGAWAIGRSLGLPGQQTLPDSVVILSSGLFDHGFYLRKNPDVELARIDVLDHFQTFGWREGRRPNLYFDPLWYRDRYLATDTINPLVHYIQGGEAAGCQPVCFFDPIWYRRTYRVPKRQSALLHFLTHRRSQRVAPHPKFDLDFYVARHAPEIGPKHDPFEHFLKHGADRDLDPSPLFDSAAYRRTMTPDHVARSLAAMRERNIPFIHALDSA